MFQKTPKNLTCINFITSNKQKCLQNSTTIVTELQTKTVSKICFKKQNPELIFYQMYKKYEKFIFSTTIVDVPYFFLARILVINTIISFTIIESLQIHLHPK